MNPGEFDSKLRLMGFRLIPAKYAGQNYEVWLWADGMHDLKRIKVMLANNTLTIQIPGFDNLEPINSWNMNVISPSRCRQLCIDTVREIRYGD